METIKCHLYFPGYYAVASAADILLKNKVNCKIVRAPISIVRGCSFALEIKCEDEEKSKKILGTECCANCQKR